jgi:hypothetical protein
MTRQDFVDDKKCERTKEHVLLWHVLFVKDRGDTLFSDIMTLLSFEVVRFHHSTNRKMTLRMSKVSVNTTSFSKTIIQSYYDQPQPGSGTTTSRAVVQ